MGHNRCSMHDVTIIGAGVAGLTLAGALKDLGFAPVVLERARGVGGRCATRRVDGRPVDHGVPFLHGRDVEFVAQLQAVTDATPIVGWPRTRKGGGLPCQPEAFEGRDYVVAFREGVSRFPKHLARGLDVRLETEAQSLRRVESSTGRGRRVFELLLASGQTLHSRSLVLTMPVPQARRLLATLDPPSAAVSALGPLFDQVHTLPCLAVIAVYPPGTPHPNWDAWYPVESTMVHAILNDSSKRIERDPLTLVVQGRPTFSREHLEASPDVWSKELLWEAGEFVGDWVERPAIMQTHRWESARVQQATELAAPMAIELEHGEILGLCGDAFATQSGLEGAFRSGIALAPRIADMVGSRFHV